MSRISIAVFSLVCAAINLGADRITKVLAVNLLSAGERYSFLGDLVVIQLAMNEGAFLSMGANWPIAIKYVLLLILPILFCLAALVYCVIKEESLGRALIIATLVGGGLGNLIDRLFNDFRVVDFLNFGIGGLRTGILNVADLSVTFGAIVLVIYEWRREKALKASKPS